MSSDFCVVLTTFADNHTARKMAEGLIEHRLAACIQTFPITSYYRWKDSVNRDAEVLMSIKTVAANYPAVEKFIRDHHDYDCPEIIRLPIASGFAEYLAWIRNECDFPE